MPVIKDISELTPTAQKACNAFLYECEQQGLKVRITETYRSQERQNELYAQGRTNTGQIVTWTKKSRHTSRRAWDICQDVKGQEYSDTAFFKKCGAVAKELGITWGGTWKTPDMPHFEIGEIWGEEEMTLEEKRKFNALVAQVEKLTKAVEQSTMVFNYFDENFPSWAKDTVQNAVDKGIVKGTENGLGLTMQDIKALCFIERLGLI